MSPTPEPVPTLGDGVVTLRAHRREDVPRVVEQCRDEESVRWTTVPTPYDEQDAVGFVTEVVPAGWADGSEWAFAVEVDGRFGGTVSLRDEGGGRAELAFGAHPDVRGTGALERACRLLLEWGFAERGVQTVVWRAYLGNWASRRLAWRLGFSFEGTVRRYLDQRGLLRTTWFATLLAEDPREPRTPWLANPVVAGDGVRLRPFTTADAPRVVEGLGDEQTQYWLAFMPRDPGPVEGLAYVEQVTERLATGHTVTWAVDDGTDERLLGVVGLYRVQEEPELGYWTHPEARGRGLTTRACALAVDHAFGALGMPRLAAYVSVPNEPSQAVLRRLGFRPTGVQRGVARTGAGEVVDLQGYDMLADEWAGSAALGRSTENATARTTNPASEETAPTSSGER